MKNLTLVTFFTMIVLSCERSNEDDFRDSFIGNYSCIEVYYSISGDTINPGWLVSHWDTSEQTKLVVISLLGDSSLEVNASDMFNFVAHYTSGNKFTCLDCGGPPNYAEFFSGDSIEVSCKLGVTNRMVYYGKKKSGD